MFLLKLRMPLVYRILKTLVQVNVVSLVLLAFGGVFLLVWYLIRRCMR